MRLPERFADEMAALLGDEAERFFASYDEPKQAGLRVNGLKLTGGAYAARFGRGGQEIPWADGGYYKTDEDERPGKHPHYYAGLYYIQEPSAMAPAELLGVEPGHRVLDLCAAPGGKTTQLAAKLQGRGLLVTNDNAAERTKALAKNVERAGVRNAVVTNEEPSRLAAAFGDLFDRVLVDAPCSGEGMFRKDEDMARLWEPNWPRRYAAMQDAILADAARMVAPGGRLLYSTCTFTPVENEGTIARFLAASPDFSVVPIAAPEAWGFAPGRPDWLTPEEAAALGAERQASLAGAVRLWPHRCRGEGHFAALLRRESAEAETAGASAGDKQAGVSAEAETTSASAEAQPAETSAGAATGDKPAETSVWSVSTEGHPASAGVEATDGIENGPSSSDAADALGRAARPGADRRSREAGDRPPSSGAGKGGRRADRAVEQTLPSRSAPTRRAHGKGASKPRAAGAETDVLGKFAAFAAEALDGWQPPGRLLAKGDYLYALPRELSERQLQRLKVVRPGWLLGVATKHRFEPSQALAMGLTAGDAARTLLLDAGEDLALRYLRGETLQPDADRVTGRDGHPSSGRGWTLVCIDGYPAGWGRWDGATMKNELLPGWRWI
ncbi:RsmB/NOP family class I SAM-dependent RNA methyltransferase [Cohnella nanjingensis]|uniref:RsmF rRNA methyltransferase first C-terminal domain-containing protein n=1 Tax=Cohnella nanjingensis TaxID=1387779 RepID=A0A7X0VJ44_9BACL|nr:RsmB/NOP family class I SAM-dependent RNA methyltransferase [Cohnella nanjingensis]MBB6674334.1 RsmF rRNA methyltransferase first C-terminal domain-containing protein [Cohnella nanjingensis]